MIGTNANKLFNEAFFLMLNYEENKDLFPLWKSFSFKNYPISDLLEAKTILDTFLIQNPDFVKAIFLKSIVLRQLNYTEESILYFHQTKEHDLFLYPCNVYLAEYYIHKLKFNDALYYLEEVNTFSPNNVRVIMLLALAKIELFQFQEAKRYLNLLYTISSQKKIIELLLENISITEAIIENTSNHLILKNFKLKSVNYNLQLKTNLTRKFNQYQEAGIPYDAVNCFIYALILKNITAYPNVESYFDYTVNTILNFLAIENNDVILKLESIHFDHDFVHSYEEYQEVELLMKEDF